MLLCEELSLGIGRFILQLREEIPRGMFVAAVRDDIIVNIQQGVTIDCARPATMGGGWFLMEACLLP